MQLSRSAILLASAWFLAMLLPACSSSSEFGGAIIGKKKADKEESSGDDDGEEVDEPQQVAGAFLACSYMDSKEGVIETIKSGPDAEVDIGCGFYSRQAKAGLTKRSLTGANVNWKMMMGQAKYDKVTIEDLPESHPLSVRLKVPVVKLAGTIHAEVRNDNEQLGVRRKSIPSIATFDAEEAFDGEEYFSLTSGQPSFDSATKQFKAASDQADRIDFFAIVAQALIAYKAPVTQPVTVDRGDTIYQVKNYGSGYSNRGGGSGNYSGGSSGSGSYSSGKSGNTAGGTTVKPSTAGGSGTAAGAASASGNAGEPDKSDAVFKPIGSTNMGQGAAASNDGSGSGGNSSGSTGGVGAASGESSGGTSGGDGGGSTGGAASGNTGGTGGGATDASGGGQDKS